MQLRCIRWRHTDARRAERGSLTLEASAVLFLFVLAAEVLFSFVNVVRAERAVQLALDKTALEVSEYCYPAAAVADTLSDAVNRTEKERAEAGEKTSLFLKAAGGLLSLGRETAGEAYSAPEVAEDLYRRILSGATSGDAASLQEIVRGAFSAYGKTPAEAITAIAAGMGKYEASGLLSHAVAVPLCEQLVPANLSSPDADRFLRGCGVVGGISGIDYSLSSVLPDGNEIRLCAVYDVQLGGGLFPWKVRVLQSASTGAWCAAGEKKGFSVWSLGGLARGKRFVSMAKEQSPLQAVKAGVGFDLYDTKENKVTSVISLNVFSATYSVYRGTGEEGVSDPSDYTLQEKKVKSALKTAALKMQNALMKTVNGKEIAAEYGGSFVFRKDGVCPVLRVMIPEEADVFSDKLSGIGADVEKTAGVHIEFIRKDKALE